MFKKMFLFYLDIREYYKPYHTNLASTEDQFGLDTHLYTQWKSMRFKDEVWGNIF